MENKVFTFYQTDEPNLLGGFMTYGTLSEAWDAVQSGRGTQITAVTCADADWWYGKHTNYLATEISRGVIYRKGA